MLHVLLIIVLSIDFCTTNDPILIAFPYPFNTTKSTQLECFSNEQGIIQSLTIVATMLDKTVSSPLLQSSKDNVTKNESVLLIIPAPFNYSQLHSTIECRSKYPHGAQKMTRLEVLSVAEITQNEFLTIDTYTKRVAIIHCRTYGTNVSIHWYFTRDSSKNAFSSLPIGIRIHHNHTLNDTLIIEHVSYSLHHGYYRCLASNQLLNRIYEDRSIVYLKVRKDRSWILLVILLIIFGICVLVFALWAKYYRKKRPTIPKRDNEFNDRADQMITPIEQSMEASSSRSKQSVSESMLKLQRTNLDHLSQAVNLIEPPRSFLSTEKERNSMSFSPTPPISNRSPQFILGSPFLDPNAQPLFSVKQFPHKMRKII